MADEQERATFYDACAALPEIKAMWLKLSDHLRTLAVDCPDWIDNPKAAAEAMELAAQAEACMWRATGDFDAIDADKWVPALRARTDSQQPRDGQEET